MTIRCMLLAALVVGSIPTATAAARVDHRGSAHVCHDGWVERGPADHPIAPAYVGDTFVIERRLYAVVRHTNGRTERFAKGKLVHRDKRSSKPFVYRGWISVDALRCS